MTLPPDWALERALTILGSGWSLTTFHHYYSAQNNGFALTVVKVAEYVADHEEPPVDPDLIQARNVLASHHENQGFSSNAEACRRGDYDDRGWIGQLVNCIKWGRANP